MMCHKKLAESAKSAGDDSAYMLCQQNVPTACGLWPASGFCRAAAAHTSTVVLTSSI